MDAFYVELATRVLALANALQYENAANLLILALSASDDPAPDLLLDAWTDFRFFINAMADRDDLICDPHDYLEAGVAHVEQFLEDAAQQEQSNKAVDELRQRLQALAEPIEVVRGEVRVGKKRPPAPGFKGALRLPGKVQDPDDEP